MHITTGVRWQGLGCCVYSFLEGGHSVLFSQPPASQVGALELLNAHCTPPLCLESSEVSEPLTYPPLAASQPIYPHRWSEMGAEHALCLTPMPGACQQVSSLPCSSSLLLPQHTACSSSI